MDNLTFKNPRQAFQDAIDKGALSIDPKKANYAGKWMYMHTDEAGVDAFKNINFRNYIYVG